jgi:hypothetical protein
MGRVQGQYEGVVGQPVFSPTTAVPSPRVGAGNGLKGAILNGISGQGAEVR